MSETPDNPMQWLADSHHNQIVTMQAAWIEWRYGRGADAAMQWIENTLDGPGLIPEEGAEYGEEAQAWFDEHRADPYPRCFCGRPSHIQTHLGGFCSGEHQRTADEIAKRRQGGDQ